MGFFCSWPCHLRLFRRLPLRIFVNNFETRAPLIMGETLQLRGTLTGHNGWVTQIATNPKFPEMILSSSRDKSLIVWKLTRDAMDSGSGGSYGVPQKRLHGHGHFVSDVVL